mmetsp:Transcript_47057/g.145643  ORF Transcript_47057/g.145643 Transcript_47057/m.145643 type:complete len:292 (+) Transcript_47057:867-1742(+)
MLLKIFCCRKGAVRANSAGMAPSTTMVLAEAPDPTPAAWSAATSLRMSSSAWVSSKLAVRCFASRARQLSCFACSCSTIAAGLAGDTSKVTVSKKASVFGTGTPSFCSSLAKSCARPWTRLAMCLRPSVRWYTAYMPAMFASSTCAVQTFDVALSRRMCCSRVCSVSLYAGFPRRSMDSPMMRPGILRTCFLLVAKKAADGPPNHMGTPNRCIEPTTTSAPNSLGGLATTSASGSAATTRCAPFLCSDCPSPVKSCSRPVVSGYCTSAPQSFVIAAKSVPSWSPTISSMPK